MCWRVTTTTHACAAGGKGAMEGELEVHKKRKRGDEQKIDDIEEVGCTCLKQYHCVKSDQAWHNTNV